MNHPRRSRAKNQMGNSRPDQRSRITEARRPKPDPNHLVDGKYAIADLVDLKELKKLFQEFSEATGFTIGFLDHPGLNVLIATGWLDICTKFHRANPISMRGCLKSNLHLLGQLSQPLQTSIEKCEHGLVDCATPIIIKGKHIASLATGQLLLAQPDRERFRRQAAAYGYDEQAYLAALEKVKVVDAGKLQRATAFLGTLAQMISEKGYVNLLFKEKAGRLQAEIEERRRVESALRESEALLQKANRMLQAIRDCHEAMLRANTEEELLQGVCRIIVQTAGEQTAWVGLAERQPRRTVRPVASAGISTEYLKTASITWDLTPRGRGPVGTAIHTGKPCLCRNTLTDPQFAPWRQLARQFGFGSVLALPLVINGECIGALVIKAAQPDAFDAGEQLLLMDFANDLAFGINTLRLRAERERLEDEVVKSVEREQERIGRDLHDGLCQMLVGAKYHACILQRISKSQFPEVKQQASTLEGMLNQTITFARDLSRSLNPARITPANLAGALQLLASSVDSANGTRCSCQLKPVKISDQQAAEQVYRIAQEAVQNAVKHARAKNISIMLTSQDDRILLGVQDDGLGIALRRKRRGMGLRNMETRARLIGGRLEVVRREGGGTTVSCEFVQPTREPA